MRRVTPGREAAGMNCTAWYATVGARTTAAVADLGLAAGCGTSPRYPWT